MKEGVGTGERGGEKRGEARERKENKGERRYH